MRIFDELAKLHGKNTIIIGAPPCNKRALWDKTREQRIAEILRMYNRKRKPMIFTGVSKSNYPTLEIDYRREIKLPKQPKLVIVP